MKKFYASLLIFIFVSVYNALSAPISNFPVTIYQPDGTRIDCLVSGDEYYSRYHSASNYTIIINRSDGYYYWAVADGDTLLPSKYRVDQTNPSQLGLMPGAVHSIRYIEKKVAEIKRMTPAKRKIVSKNDETVQVANTGTINNLVVFIRFSDEDEFTDQHSVYDTLFNAVSGRSMRSYYKEVTYNQLTINSIMYPATTNSTVVSYMSSNPRAYYMPYSAANTVGYNTETERTEREHALLRDCINSVSSQIPSTLNIDNDNDGYVDNVCFIVDGSPTAWSTLLWPHRWSLYSYDVRINGLRVYDYNLQIRSHLLSSQYSVLAHEMFHSLGAPDLYHYNSTAIDPVGSWDIMNSGYSHMLAYMKMKYGKWLDSIPTVTESGDYAVNSLLSGTRQAYKIKSPYSETQYFVVEYRKNTGLYESYLPGAGLLIYRINTQCEGNADGPPDEIYVYRPGGTSSGNGNLNQAAFSTQNGRTAFYAGTNPEPFLADGSPGGVRITQIGASGADTMKFHVTISLVKPKLIYPTNKVDFVERNPVFKWFAVPGAETYRIEISTSANFAVNMIDNYCTTAQYSVLSQFAFNQKFYWRVKSVSSVDSSAWSDAYSFRVRHAEPGVYYSENFGNTSALPAGWLVTQTDPAYAWESVSAGDNPSCLPASASQMMKYDSYDAPADASSDLISSAISNLTAGGPKFLKVKIFRDADLPQTADRTDIYFSQTPSAEGANYLTTVNRAAALSPIEESYGWHTYEIELPHEIISSANYAIFRAVSKYGDNIYLDDVSVTGIPGSIGIPVPLSPIAGAMIRPDSPVFVWQSVSGATSYRIRVSEDSLFSTVVIDTEVVSSLTGVGLTYDKTYYWQAKAYSGTETGTWSAKESFGYIRSLYCPAGAVCDEYIAGVSLGDYSGTSDCTEGGYADNTSTRIELLRGQSYTLTVRNGKLYTSDRCGAWVDWNKDYDFSDTGDSIPMPGIPGPEYYAGTINVPSGLACGDYRLRIRIVYNTDPVACGTLDWGETEDYTIVVGDEQKIPLTEGWNNVGLYIEPAHKRIDSVCAGIASNLLLAVGLGDNVFVPNSSTGNLFDWNITGAYRLYMSSSDTLKVFGSPVKPYINTITLDTGVNFVPYMLSVQRSPQSIFGRISDKIFMVTDLTDYYIPSLNISTLTMMMPGKAYFVKVNQNCSFSYSLESGAASRDKTRNSYFPEGIIILPKSPYDIFLGQLPR